MVEFDPLEPVDVWVNDENTEVNEGETNGRWIIGFFGFVVLEVIFAGNYLIPDIDLHGESNLWTRSLGISSHKG